TIANRLGINSIRVELEDLGFFALHPMRARNIEGALRRLRGDHESLIQEIKERIQCKLDEMGIQCRIQGREKHLNSIYQKMKAKRRSFHEIMDVYAFRIITDSADNCYRILVAMHAPYIPFPGRCKDNTAQIGLASSRAK